MKIMGQRLLQEYTSIRLEVVKMGDVLERMINKPNEYESYVYGSSGSSIQL